LDAGRANRKKLKKRQQRGIKDRHGWNTLESYKQVYLTKVGGHPFVDDSHPLPEIKLISSENGQFIKAGLEGRIYCNNNIVLEVRKHFNVRYLNNGLIKIKGVYYCYNAHISGNSNILRYDNSHGDDDYHKHEFDLATGKEKNKINLTRHQFPLLHEVLDELQRMFEI